MLIENQPLRLSVGQITEGPLDGRRILEIEGETAKFVVTEQVAEDLYLKLTRFLEDDGPEPDLRRVQIDPS